MADLIDIIARANLHLADALHYFGRTGRVEADGTITISVAERIGYIYVRVGVADDVEGVIEARNIGAPLKAGQRIVYRRDTDGEWSVVGLDYLSGLLGSQDYHVAYHQHGRGSGLDWIVPANMVQVGRVHWTGDALNVNLTAFRYLHDSTWQTYNGGEIDLASYLPSNTGAWAWILIGIDPDTNSPVAVKGDEYAYAQPLGLDLLDDISFDNWIPLGAIQARNDDTEFSDATRYYDAHGWFNQGGGGGAGAEAFTDLSDVPSDYTGEAGSFVAVNSTPDGLTFLDVGEARTALGLVAGGAGDIWLEKAGDTLAGNLDAASTYKIVNLPDPSSAQDAATKAYVDAVQQALDIKASVRAATTANITLSGAQTIDGVSVIAGDRVLVKDQSTGADNGIYVAAAGAWARSADANVSAEVTAGIYTFVAEGTANGDNGFVLTTNDPIALGTTALTFTQFSGAGQVIAGDGLAKSGNTLSVNVDNSTVEINSDTLRVKDAGITYAKIQNIATDRLLGRTSSGSGVVQEIPISDYIQSLLSAADAAAARTTLALGTMATQAEANYLLLAGRSGGQRVTGLSGTGYALEVYRNQASGDTDSPVMFVYNDHASDDQQVFWVKQDAAATAAIIERTNAGMLLSFAGSYSLTEGSNTFGTGFYRASASNDQVTLSIIRGSAAETIYNAGVNGDTFRRFLIEADGLMRWGPGSVTRDTTLERIAGGGLKFGNNGGYDGFAAETGVNGSVTTVFPAGTVTAAAFVSVVVVPSSGTPQAMTPAAAITLGASVIIFFSGANEVTLQVTAGGAITVQRTGGALTYTVALKALWI